MICEAGVTLAEAQAAALAADRLFPLSLASEGTCTIGGNVSTNAGGVTVIAYGNTRDLVTGVEAVLADGRIVNGLSKLRKDNTGYDVKDLFIGAEGTLGIVTAASLRLFPNPRARATAFVGLESPERRAELLSMVARAARRRRHQLRADRAHRAYDITVGNGLARKPAGRRARLVRADGSVVADAGRARRSARRRAGGGARARRHRRRRDRRLARAAPRILALRESIPEAQIREGASIKHDVSVEVGLVPALISEATPAVEAFAPGARVVAFGHLGDGNIHFNVSQPVGADRQAFLARWDAMNEIVHGIVARLGGSYSRRARRRSAQARPARANEGPGIACGHAPDQGGARPERGDESGQGAVTPSFAIAENSLFSRLPISFISVRWPGSVTRSQRSPVLLP